MEGERDKRGRLSSIDLLPDEARPHVVAALAHLKERRRTQEQIREELNGHLLALGVPPVSRSAFNRTALTYAAYGQKIVQAREIAAVFQEDFSRREGDVGALLIETLKTMIYDVVMAGSLTDEAASVKMLKEASLAVARLESARKISVGTRKTIMTEFAAAAESRVAEVVKARGLSAETAEAIKAKILGIVA